MPRPDNFEKWFTRWKKLTESLFGTVEEITEDEAREILAAGRVDRQRLRDELYARLSDYAASLRTKGQPVPDQILETLETFRPETAPPRNVEELERSADRWLAKLLHPVRDALGQPQIAFSYRKKSELLPQDREVLDQLAKKLEERIKTR